MLFEIFNEKNVRVFVTCSEECIPEKRYIDSMLSVGYKFKMDGKILTKKAINELLNGRK